MIRALLVLLSILWPWSAGAQWMSSANENPFERTTQHFAFTALNAAVFGFSCQSERQNPALIFVLPEAGATQAAADNLSAVGPKLSVIVDDADPVSLDASIDVVEMFGVMRFRVKAFDEAAVDVAKGIAGAKRRVAVATRIAGQTLHPTSFGVAGSGREVRGALTKCGY